MRKILFILLISMLIMSLSVPFAFARGRSDKAAEEAVPDEEKMVFSYVTLGDAANLFIATTIVGWNDAMETFGAESQFSYGDWDYATMQSHIEAAIAAEVDGLFIFQWEDRGGVNPLIQQAIDKGIQVVVMNQRYPKFTPAQVPFIGVDYVEQGRVTGKYMAEQLQAAGRTSDLNVAVFTETIDATLGVERRDGFLQGLTEGGITFTSDYYESGGEPVQSLDIIKSYIIAHPELDVITGIGSISAPTAVMALIELGYEPGGEIFWIGFNITPDIADAIKAGWGATNVDDIWGYGYLAATVLWMRAKYGATVGDLPVYTEMVDQSNLEDYMWLIPE